MLAMVRSCAIIGLDGALVEVEVDMTNGLAAFVIVGLPDAAVNEAKERVRAAIKNSSCLFPFKHITSSKGKGWYFKQADVEQFISVVMQYAQKKSCDSLDVVSLARFRPFTNWTLKDTLLAVFNGSLKLTDMETQQPLFQRLVLTCEEVNRFLEDIARQSCQNLGLFTVREVASRLGVNGQLVRRWINEGFIEAETLTIGKVRASLRISLGTIEAFSKTYVFAEEAAELLSVTLGRLSNYVHRGKLHSLGSKGQKLLFLREEVESLKLTLASDGGRRGRNSRK